MALCRSAYLHVASQAALEQPSIYSATPRLTICQTFSMQASASNTENCLRFVTPLPRESSYFNEKYYLCCVSMCPFSSFFILYFIPAIDSSDILYVTVCIFEQSFSISLC